MEDLFGNVRKYCEACDKDCPGYQPQGVVCPVPKNELDFPTFCMHCGCPACFHTILKISTHLPEQMGDEIRMYNIRQSDINFNSVLAIFEPHTPYGENDDSVDHIHKLIEVLKSEGLEILSFDHRSLDI